MTTAFGCSGSHHHERRRAVTIPATDDLSAVFDASYTDAGSGNLPPLTGTDEVVIEPVAP